MSTATDRRGNGFREPVSLLKRPILLEDASTTHGHQGTKLMWTDHLTFSRGNDPASDMANFRTGGRWAEI